MFKNIQQFEDYLFSIKTDEQLKRARYKEADCLAFYESLGDLARVQVYKDITERIGQLIAKDRHSNMTILKMLYRMLFGKKDLNTIIEKAGDEFIEHSEKFQMKYYPLVRAIVMNIQNIDDARKTLVSEMASIRRMDEVNREENNQFISDILDSKPVLKEYKDQVVDMFQNGIIGVPDQLEKMNEKSESHPEELTEDEKESKYKDIITSTWFQRAFDQNFITKENNQYRWLGTKGELALFAELLSEKLEIKSKWKIFEGLFGEKRLASAKDRVTGNYGSGTFGRREKEIKDIFEVR